MSNPKAKPMKKLFFATKIKFYKGASFDTAQARPNAVSFAEPLIIARSQGWHLNCHIIGYPYL